MRCTTLTTAGSCLLLALGTTVSADTFAIDVDGLEVLYGGFIGDVFEETPFDFETAFDCVAEARLELVGNTDLRGSTVTFTAIVDGVVSETVQIMPESNAVDVSVTLPVPASVLDGTGVIGLEIGTSHPHGADLSTLISEAVLVFETCGCAEDVDGDGVVGVQDIIDVVLAWGPCGKECPADVDENNVVDVNDLVAVLLAWGDCE